MTMAEKIRNLRTIEGSLRGLGRPMTQEEVSKAMRKQLGKTISQSYLSLIESGTRPHLSAHSRQLLARFFKVHPGYLVSDPPGYHTELTSDLRTVEGRLDEWLIKGSEQFAGDAPLHDADDNRQETSSDGGTKAHVNRGQLIADATCAPADIRYPSGKLVSRAVEERHPEIHDRRLHSRRQRARGNCFASSGYALRCREFAATPEQ
jgi:transcriptional regulator with XRE-family HTH domain